MSVASPSIEVFFDPDGTRNGLEGCFRARIADHPGVHDAGQTEEEALENLLITAASLGFSGNQEDYVIAFR